MLHPILQVESLIHDLTASFKEMVQEADWMTEETKRAALKKVSKAVVMTKPLKDGAERIRAFPSA